MTGEGNLARQVLETVGKRTPSLPQKYKFAIFLSNVLFVFALTFLSLFLRCLLSIAHLESMMGRHPQALEICQAALSCRAACPELSLLFLSTIFIIIILIIFFYKRNRRRREKSPFFPCPFEVFGRRCQRSKRFGGKIFFALAPGFFFSSLFCTSGC